MSEIIQTHRYKDFEAYKIALSNEPREGWLKERSIGNNKNTRYSPIEIKQALADVCFRNWEVIDEKYMNVLNEIVCTVKIMALPDYPGAEEITFTGSASKPIACDKDSKAELFPKGKKSNALEYCLPAVRSEAIGNALETLGNLFGRNVNRSVSNNYSFDVSYTKDSDEKP